MRHLHKGIDIASGREFGAVPGRSDYAWLDDSPIVPQRLLERAPVASTGNASFQQRFATLVWLDMVDEEKDQAQIADLLVPPAPAGEQPATRATPAPEVKNVPEALPPSSSAQDPTRHAEPVPPERPPRSWRLSREPGPVNALAFAALLGKPGVGTTDEVLAMARDRVVAWLQNKGFKQLQGIVSGQQHLPDGEATIETDGAALWAMRLDDRKQMQTGAFWRVELTLFAGQECALGLRLYQIRSSKSAPDPVSGVPAVIRDISAAVGMRDAGAWILPSVRQMVGAQDLEWFQAQLRSPDRSLALVAVSTTGHRPVDPSIERLAARLTGLAHVVCVEPAMASRLDAVLGTRHRVFGNAIRVYRPAFDHADPPGDHPYWTFGGQTLSPHLGNLIAEAVCSVSVQREDLDERAPSFRQVRESLSQARLQALREGAASIATTAEEERARQMAINAELERALSNERARAEELQAQVRTLHDELQAVIRERDEALDQGRRDRRALQWMQVGDQGEPEEGSEDEEAYYPDTWDDLETWVDLFGDGRIVLHPSAAKAARASPFADIPLAYKAMELLVTRYVPMRTRDPEDDQPRVEFEQALVELGLECSPVGTAVDNRRYRQEYRRIHEGKKITLDMHLKKGGGFDPATLFRLYFHYCEQTQRVIVGHLPGHLTNTITHSG